MGDRVAVKKTEPKKGAKRAKRSRKYQGTIKLAREVYGTNARASAIADFVELACLAGFRPSLEELEDRLKDTGTTLPPEKYVMYDEPDPDLAEGAEDAPELYADATRRVVDLINERAKILGNKYPFEVSHNRIVERDSHDGESYLALLALTIAHAYEIPTTADPKRLFEETVARVLNAKGWKAASLPGRTKSHGFKNGFKSACTACEIPTGPAAALISRSAVDEGVDTIAHDSWGDDRKGRWTLIGQATLEKSDGWKKKIRQPSTSLFAALFGDFVEPLPFLAVPHHVEPLHLEKLVQDTRSVVLDRLRLASFDGHISSEERTVLQAVRACQVEYR